MEAGRGEDDPFHLVRAQHLLPSFSSSLSISRSVKAEKLHRAQPDGSLTLRERPDIQESVAVEEGSKETMSSVQTREGAKGGDDGREIRLEEFETGDVSLDDFAEEAGGEGSHFGRNGGRRSGRMLVVWEGTKKGGVISSRRRVGG